MTQTLFKIIKRFLNNSGIAKTQETRSNEQKKIDSVVQLISKYQYHKDSQIKDAIIKYQLDIVEPIIMYCFETELLSYLDFLSILDTNVQEELIKRGLTSLGQDVKSTYNISQMLAILSQQCTEAFNEASDRFFGKSILHELKLENLSADEKENSIVNYITHECLFDKIDRYFNSAKGKINLSLEATIRSINTRMVNESMNMIKNMISTGGRQSGQMDNIIAELKALDNASVTWIAINKLLSNDPDENALWIGILKLFNYEFGPQRVYRCKEKWINEYKNLIMS